LLFLRLGKPDDTNKTDRAFDQGYQYCTPSLHGREELECISKHARDAEPLLRTSIEHENECSAGHKITPTVKRKRTSISSSVGTGDDTDETMEETWPDILGQLHRPQQNGK